MTQLETPPGKVSLEILKSVRPYTPGDLTAMKPELAQKWIDKGYARVITPESHPETFERYTERVQRQKAKAKVVEDAEKARRLDNEKKAAEYDAARAAEEEAKAKADAEAEAAAPPPAPTRSRKKRSSSS